MNDPYETLVLLAPRVADDDLARVRDRVRLEIAGGAADHGAPGHRGRWLVGVAAAGAVATSLVLWPTSTPSAFAGWTATPKAAPADEVARVQRSCDATLVNGIEQARSDPARLALPEQPRSADEVANRHVLVAEQRGSYTYVLSSNGTFLIGCLDAADLADGLGEASSTRLATRPALAGPDAVDVLQGGGVGTPGGETAVLAAGRAGADVTGIELVTPAGRTVDASLAAGAWAAWWPAEEEVDATWGQTRVVVHLADGSTRQAGTLDSLNAVPLYAGTGPTPAPSTTGS